MVTPCVGVWIETPYIVNSLDGLGSHPAWVCGLKLLTYLRLLIIVVTPCVGVWIETLPLVYKTLPVSVTPCVGVWIETRLEMIVDEKTGHTLRGCVD